MREKSQYTQTVKNALKEAKVIKRQKQRIVLCVESYNICDIPPSIAAP